MDDTNRSGSNVLAQGLDDLIRAHRILEMEGHEDLTLGHMSWRDPQGRGFWMKLQGISLGEVHGTEDLVLMDFDGNVIEGDGRWVHAEWPIHAELLKARPEIEAAGHTHPFYACAFSSTGEVLRAVAHEGAFFGENVPHFKDTSDLIKTPELGAACTRAMGAAFALFVGNHGVTFCGHTIKHAMLMGIFLEKACRHQLLMQSTGLDWRWVEGEEIEKKKQWLKPEILDACWRFYNRKLDRFEHGRGLEPVPPEERIAPWFERHGPAGGPRC
ncbi:MAG TPA: class II aldolase/adducin family protein [bacterium]|jgi:ribulose-5-phosphate 4-epimerase/fuculose-1-phosphate aldolase